MWIDLRIGFEYQWQLHVFVYPVFLAERQYKWRDSYHEARSSKWTRQESWLIWTSLYAKDSILALSTYMHPTTHYKPTSCHTCPEKFKIWRWIYFFFFCRKSSQNLQAKEKEKRQCKKLSLWKMKMISKPPVHLQYIKKVISAAQGAGCVSSY